MKKSKKPAASPSANLDIGKLLQTRVSVEDGIEFSELARRRGLKDGTYLRQVVKHHLAEERAVAEAERLVGGTTHPSRGNGRS